MNVLLIALGGSIGAVARYGLAGLVQRFTTPYFPFGTFVVNMVGCFVFGILAGVAEHRFALGPQARAFLLIGVLGGFTTFSSFSFETFQLLRRDHARIGECRRPARRRPVRDVDRLRRGETSVRHG